MTASTFTILECSVDVLPWRLVLKLLSNIMFVLIGKSTMFSLNGLKVSQTMFSLNGLKVGQISCFCTCVNQLTTNFHSQEVFLKL